MGIAHGGASAEARRDNSYDLLRLLASLAVVFSHSYVLTGSTDPLFDVLDNQLSFLGVLAFFGLSGFLIAQSFLVDPRPRAFVVKRALRILPALLVAAVATAFVIGPLVTTLPLRDYLTDPQPFLYVLKSAFVATFNTALPGVFEDTPYPVTVNGSLWTIPLEVTCYVLVMVAGILGLLRRPRVLLAIFVLALAALAVGASPESDTGASATGIDVLLNAVRVGAAFLCGVLVFHHRDRLPATPWIATGILLAAVLLPLPAGPHAALTVLVIPVWVHIVGRRRPGALARGVSSVGDVSYGAYIYAYPLQQLLVHAIPSLRPGTMLLLCTPLILIVAYASWRLVEAPALRRKQRWAGRPPAVAPTTPAVVTPAPDGVLAAPTAH